MKMTNKEFYADQIIEIARKGKTVAVVNNKPTICEDTDCKACIACSDIGGVCYDDITDWFDEEYEEPMVKVIHAKWVKDNYNDGYVGYSYYYCSHCKTENKLTAYCPHCGAKMEWENTDDKR